MDNIRKRKPIRLDGYDYSKNGCYFITICTKYRGCIFGEVVDGVMRLNEYGDIAKIEVLKIPAHYILRAVQCFKEAEYAMH